MKNRKSSSNKKCFFTVTFYHSGAKADISHWSSWETQTLRSYLKKNKNAALVLKLNESGS